MHGSCEGPSLSTRRPATAGIHSPRPLLLKHDGATSAQKYHSLWLWVPACAGTTDRYGLAFSRRDAPELCFEFSPPKIRGRREGRVLAGTRGLVCNRRRENAHEHTGISRGI